MKLAKSGSRGVFWRSSIRGTQEIRRRDLSKDRGDWWVRWVCQYRHIHRALVGAKSRAQQEVERCRVERPCPKHRPKPSMYGRVRFLSDAEEKSLRGVLATDEDQERLTVLLQTGLRRTEFLELRWRDVDLKTGFITIPRSKNGETRHVPMTSEVRSILSKRPRPLDSGRLVFPNSVGHPDQHWAQKAFPEAVGAARIEDFRFHDTRHTFASRLAMTGADVLTIKDLGGWKSLAMVQRYAHLSPSHRQQAIERLVGRRSAMQASASE